jgi:hypothetical protein
MHTARCMLAVLACAAVAPTALAEDPFHAALRRRAEANVRLDVSVAIRSSVVKGSHNRLSSFPYKIEMPAADYTVHGTRRYLIDDLRVRVESDLPVENSSTGLPVAAAMLVTFDGNEIRRFETGGQHEMDFTLLRIGGKTDSLGLHHWQPSALMQHFRGTGFEGMTPNLREFARSGRKGKNWLYEKEFDNGRHDTYEVDPAQDYAIVRHTIEFGNQTFETTVRHEGSRPKEWTRRVFFPGEKDIISATMTATYAELPAQLPDSLFTIEPAPYVLVRDEKGRKDYRFEDDGTKTMVRLNGSEVKPKVKVDEPLLPVPDEVAILIGGGVAVLLLVLVLLLGRRVGRKKKPQ